MASIGDANRYEFAFPANHTGGRSLLSANEITNLQGGPSQENSRPDKRKGPHRAGLSFRELPGTGPAPRPRAALPISVRALRYSEYTVTDCFAVLPAVSVAVTVRVCAFAVFFLGPVFQL